MKTLLLAAGLVLGLATASQAMPVTPMADHSYVVTVAGGCGAGWHRGPNGGCLRNYANPAAHACPRGYHVGPNGRCRANW